MSGMPRGDLTKMVTDRFENIPIIGKPVAVLRDPDVLMLITTDVRPKSDHFTTFFTADDESHYESFFNDFGPYNLAVLYRYCTKLHKRVKAALQLNKTLVQYASSNNQKRVNAAFLSGAYAIILHGLTGDQAWMRLREAQPPKFIPFRDAAMGPSTYDLLLLDVFRGLHKACSMSWVDFVTFDVEEYEHYERVENGDFNWIIPNKFMAFCGPHNKSIIENGYPYHSPDVYFDYFRENNVTTIIRLNRKIYDAKKFTNAGFKHLDMFFVDGSTPNDAIVLKFIEAVDKSQGAIAVHCKAGLGRTGTLIACWMMKEYGWTACDCMAWIRLCRPGSIIGPQQQFLIEKQEFCWKLGGHNSNVAQLQNVTTSHKRPGVHGITSKVDHIRLNAEQTKLKANVNSAKLEQVAKLESLVDESGRTQGDRLMAIKAQHQNMLQRPGTATFTSPTTPIKPILSAARAGKVKIVTEGSPATRRLQFSSSGGLPHKVARVSKDNTSSSIGASSSCTTESRTRSNITERKTTRKSSSLSPSSNQPRIKRSSLGAGEGTCATRKLNHNSHKSTSALPTYALRPRKTHVSAGLNNSQHRKMYSQRGTNYTK